MTANVDRLDPIQAEFVQRLQDVDELLPQSVLEGHAVDIDPARDEQHLFVFDVHALHGTDSLGKVEGFRLAEGCGGEPAAVLLVDDRRVEALLDGRPDGKRRREVIAGNGQVSPVPNADLIDLAEQVVGGVPSEHIGEPGLDAHPDQSDLA